MQYSCQPQLVVTGLIIFFGGGGNCLLLFRSMRGAVMCRNGEGFRRPGRLYVSDHSAYIGLSHCGRKMCVAALIVCTTLHFLCVMSHVCVVLISVCNSKVSVKLHKQADGGVAKKRKSKTFAKWSTNLVC